MKSPSQPRKGQLPASPQTLRPGWRLLACAAALAGAGFAQPSDADAPLRVGADHRHLVDRRGVPFLLQGDAAWSLIANATREDADGYLRNRRAKGFNAVLVNLIEHKFARNAPRNAYGDAPFPDPSDLAVPNDKYFEHADWVVRRAGEDGIVVLLAPAYLGYPGLDEGFYDEVMAAGPEKCLAYGRYLGRRYAGFDNIIWVMGGDRDPGPAREDRPSGGSTVDPTTAPSDPRRTPSARVSASNSKAGTTRLAVIEKSLRSSANTVFLRSSALSVSIFFEKVSDSFLALSLPNQPFAASSASSACFCRRLISPCRAPIVSLAWLTSFVWLKV